MSAQVTTGSHDRSACKRQELSTPAIAITPRSERGRVQGESDSVAGRVHQPDAPDPWLGSLSVCPVIRARKCRGTVRGDTNREQALRSNTIIITAKQIEQRRAQERPDDDVGHDRMQRVADPLARQEVLEADPGDRISRRGADYTGGPVEDGGTLEGRRDATER